MDKAKKIQEPVPYYHNNSLVISIDVANSWGVWIFYNEDACYTESGKGIKGLLSFVKKTIIPFCQTATSANVHLLWAQDKYKNHNTTAKLANYKGQIEATFSNLNVRVCIHKATFLNLNVRVYIHEVNENQAYNFLRFKNGIVDFTPNPRKEKKTTTLNTYNKFFDLEGHSQDVADAWMFAHWFIAEQNETKAYLAFRDALSLPIEKRVSCNWWEKELWPQEKEEK